MIRARRKGSTEIKRSLRCHACGALATWVIVEYVFESVPHLPRGGGKEFHEAWCDEHKPAERVDLLLERISR